MEKNLKECIRVHLKLTQHCTSTMCVRAWLSTCVWLFATPWAAGACRAPVRGILQAITLEWAASSYARGSCWPRDRTHVSSESCTGRHILYHCPPGSGGFHSTVEPYSAIKNNEIMPFAATRMLLEIIILSEVRQRQISYDITCGILKKMIHMNSFIEIDSQT